MLTSLVSVSICLCHSHSLSAQEDSFQFSTEFDSLYFVQFIALKDSTRTYDNLYSIGNTIKEYVIGPEICRYALGYYVNRVDALKARYQLHILGYEDAFIRAKEIPRKVNEIPRGNISFVDESKPKPKPIEETPIPKPEAESQVENNEDLTPSDSDISSGQEDIIKEAPKPISELDKTNQNFKTTNVSLLYTGKSYGTLGTTRFQEEHELATEYALDKEVEFKLVSHACWRSYGITIFMPSDEPEGGELELILDKKAQWKEIQSYPAVKTKNVLLFRDPKREHFDMLSIIKENKNTKRKFPEAEDVLITIFTTEIQDGKKCFIVLEDHATWPEELDHWRIGEINRLDFGKTGRLYELPYNQGSFGVRAELVQNHVAELSDNQSFIIKADLGHRNGYFGLTPERRIIADLNGLTNLNYNLLLPYEFELTLGNDVIQKMIKEFDQIKWIATNVNNKDKSLFHHTYQMDHKGVNIGFIGLVDPAMAINLPGTILKELEFKDVTKSAQEAVTELYDNGANIIIALSNMSPGDNAKLGQNVMGIDAIVANIYDSRGLSQNTKQINLNREGKRGLGAPLIITENYDYGAGLGVLNLQIRKTDEDKYDGLDVITSKILEVNDDNPSDAAIVQKSISDLPLEDMEKGSLMIPSFTDLKVQQPKLITHDEVTKHGRISKGLWEQFLANLLRNSAPAEVSLVRKVRSFPPLIGKIHQREVHSWLRMEDEIVVMDMKGRDIRRLMEADTKKTLTSSGVSSFEIPRRKFWFVMGRFMREDVYYRVATTNIVINGEFAEHFRWALRKKNNFSFKPNGILKPDKEGESMKLKDFVIHDLKRIRSLGKSTVHHKNIANLFIPSQPYEKLFSFHFDKPTIWASFNKSYKGDGYESVPESRIINRNSLILGAQGGFTVSLDKAKYEWALGARVAYAQQSADVGADSYQRTETMDDININLTYTYKGVKRKALHPFARLVYDSEFTSTFNTSSEQNNAKQSILRSVVGLGKQFSRRWPVLEFGLTAENDFSNNNYQYGIQGRSVGRFPLDKYWNVMYLITNNINYYFPSQTATDRELSFRYNMVHEVLVPLYGDISLSVAGDFFFFKGKTEVNSQPGLNMLLRLGFTYNRVWKPKYQRLF